MNVECEPIIHSQTILSEEFSYEGLEKGRTSEGDFHLEFQKDNLLFDGHFSSYSLVPGVGQLGHALRLACRLFGIPNSPGLFAGMEAIKFRQPIVPCQQVMLNLRLQKNKNAQIKLYFKYTSILPVGEKGQPTLFSSGRILLNLAVALTDSCLEK